MTNPFNRFLFTTTLTVKKESYDKLEPFSVKNSTVIHGDNLTAMKALENKVKLVYVDPPYNTGTNFAQYNDRYQQNSWISFVGNRLVAIRDLLQDDGSLWISIDDGEFAEITILCHYLFGKQNFVSDIIWEKKYTAANDAKWFSTVHDHILVWAKNKQLWIPNRVERTAKMDARYTNPDNDPKGPWKSTPLHAKSGTNNSSYTFKDGTIWTPPAGTFRRFTDESMKQLEEEGRISFPKKKNGTPRKKTYLSELKQGVPARTIWKYDDVGHNDEAKREAKLVVPNNPFATPKPERLLKRIITIATNENDWVLDPFFGSGTMGVVAAESNRNFIGIEVGDHCKTHAVKRLQDADIKFDFKEMTF